MGSLKGVILFLSLVLAIGNAEIGWKRSTKYVYQYETTTVSAIPELKSDFTGLGIRGKLVIEVGPGGKKLVCQIKNPEVGHTEEEITEDSSPDDWKRHVTLNWSKMPQKASDPFSQAFLVEFQEGVAKSIETPAGEPTWSVNMKKGIASQLTINLSGSNKVSISSTDSLRSRIREMNLIHETDENPREFFAVEEDAIGGKCKTLYTISPLPEVIAQSNEKDLPMELRPYYKERVAREGEPAHIITKVRDFNSCEGKAFYYMDSFIDVNQGTGNPSNNQYKMFTARSAITRYLVRGDLENFRVEKTWAQGEVIVRPYGTETEKLYTITNQTLTLLEMESPSKTPFPSDLKLGQPDSLTFRFPQALTFPDSVSPVKSHEPFFLDSEFPGSNNRRQNSQQRQRYPTSSYPHENPIRNMNRLEELFDDRSDPAESYEKFKRHHTMDSISYYPREGDGSLQRKSHLGGEQQGKLPNIFHYVFPGTTMGTLKKGEAKSVVQQVEFLIDETAKDLIDGHDIAKRGTALKAFEIARAMTILDMDDLSEVFQMVLGGSADRLLDIKRALVLDCMVMAGTEPALLFVVDLVENQKITGEEAIQLISTIPTSYKTNSMPVLKKLMDLVEKHANDPEKVENDYHKRQMWITSMLTLSRMVTQICLSSKTKSQNHPRSVHSGEGCHENSSIVTSRLLPYLEQELQNAQEKWKKAAVLQALSNIAHPHVIQIVAPYIHASAGQMSTDIHIRAKAVYALNRLADVHPHLVFKELKPVYTNFNDHYEIRMSAFSVIIKTMPPVPFWQEAATLTWFEPSLQVSSFVYSTIASLANATSPSYHNISSIARMALPLAKPQHLGLHYSHNYIFQDYVHEKQMGTTMQMGWFGSEESVVPRAGYFRLGVDAGGFGNDFVEVSLHGKGIQSAFNNFFMRYIHQKETTFQGFWDKLKEMPFTKQLPISEIQELLKVAPTTEEPLEGSISIKIAGQIERFFSFDTHSLRKLITKALDKSRIITGEGLSVDIPVSWHKLIKLPSLLGLMPSQSGLPIVVAMHRPVLVSITGKISLEMIPPKRGANVPTIVLKTNLNPTIAANNLILTGVICPVTNEVFASGVDWHASRSLPHNMELTIDSSSKKMQIDLAQFDGPTPSTIRFAHIHQRPFITRKHMLDFTPIPNIAATKFVQVEPTEVKNVTVYGKEWLGIPFILEQTLDSPFLDYAGVHRLVETYGFSSIQLIHMPHTLRKLEYSVYTPTAEITARNISAAIEYFEGDKECGIFGTECDKEVTQRFYTDQRGQPQQEWQAGLHDQRSEQMIKFFANPRASFEECQEKIKECKEIYEAQQSQEVPQSFRWRRDQIKQLDEDEVRRISSGKVRGINMKLVVESKNQGETVSQITAHYTRTNQGVGQKFTVQGELVPVGQSSTGPMKIYASGKLQYPTLEPTQRRRALLDNPQLAKAHIEVKFGPSLETGITADIAMSRSMEQKEIAENSEEAKQCEKDESRGQMYSPSCLKARNSATTINKYVIKIKAQQPTTYLRNMTYMTDDLLKYALYPYMSNNRLDIDNPKDSVTIVLDARPPQAYHPYTVIDAYVFKPQENTFFKHMKVPAMLDGIFPLNSKMSLAKLVEKKLFKDQFFPMCKLEIGTVRTFDNVTYQYPLSDCYHVIAKDCSQNVKVAVLAREKNGAKTVKIILGDETVVIRPQSEQGSAGGEESLPLIAEINGKEIRLSPTEKKLIGEPENKVEIKMRRDLEYEVTAPKFGLRVITSGRRFKVQMSNLYRGRTCGLCGDMNGERSAEFKGPSKCVFLDPLSFARSYALITRDCHMPPTLHSVSGTSGKCIPQSIKPLGFPTGYQQEDISSSSRPSSSSRSCTTYATKVVQDGDELCFSVRPLPECSLECRPVRLVNKRVGFHCLPNTPATTAIMAKARYGVVEALLNKQPHVSHHVSIPESCERIRN